MSFQYSEMTFLSVNKVSPIRISHQTSPFGYNSCYVKWPKLNIPLFRTASGQRTFFTVELLGSGTI